MNARSRDFARLAPWALGTLALLGSWAIALPAEPAAAPTWAPVINQGERTGTARKPMRYVKVREGGASVRNVADVQGLSIGEIAGGGLLAVYGERAGWVEVDAPGGFAVWVYGRFLRPTAVEGVLEVTQNNVNMRPSPSTDVNYFPLAQQLQAGDKVTRIDVQDPAAELAKTWVRVWSPAGSTGWVQAARTDLLPEGVDGAALWSQAELAIAKKAAEGGPAAGRVSEATAPRPGAAASALDLAQALLVAERERALPDFEGVRGAFLRVLALEPDAAVRSQAETALELVRVLESEAAGKAQLAAETLRRQQELVQRQAESWQEQAAKDPLDGRFAARGFLERVEGPDGAIEYRVLRGDTTVARITCPSGRYDLALFVGYEVGVEGAARFPGSAVGGPLAIETTRLEIVGRPR